jgi:hypothetical protein
MTHKFEGGFKKCESRWAVLIFLVVCVFGSVAFAKGSSDSVGNSGTGSNPHSGYVQPYGKKNGKYVRGHYKTKPNKSKKDNYGAKGNRNPYNGKTAK